MKKGITPIISIIILLLITVALAGAAWTFLQNFIYPPIAKSFIIPQNGAYCLDNKIKIYVINTGYQSDLIVKSESVGGDFILASIDNGDVLTELTGITIPTGEQDKILEYDCDTSRNPGNVCFQPAQGTYHTVDIATTSGALHPSVWCYG